MSLVSRRMTLRSLPVLGVAALTSGCDQLLGSRAPETTPTPTDPTDAPALTGDEAVVMSLLVEVTATLALVRATRRRHPSLGSPLKSAQRIHRAHRERIVELLGEQRETGDGAESTSTATPDTIAAAPGPALRKIRQAVNGLARSTTSAALSVERADLASMLATMAAGTAQIAAVLPAQAPESA